MKRKLFHERILAKIPLFGYNFPESVALNGSGFSRPIRLMRVESPSGYSLAERIRMKVKIKKILGVARSLIFDHAYNSVRSFAV